MIFEALQDSNAAGELLLVNGGYCRWHMRRDGIVVIYEILSQRPGVGAAMVACLREVPGALAIQAKCPIDLVANDWYQKRGFICISQETTRSGRVLNVWRLPLSG